MKLIGMITVFALVGCMDEAVDVELEATPKLSANALSPSQLLSLGTLNPAALDQSNLDAMASTLEGRNALAYLVGCALDVGGSVVANYIDDVGNPATMTFYGAIGLATNWASAALTATEQRLVTGCTLARTNLQEALVTVSLRGPSPALATTQTELNQYPAQEGAFFGNLFNRDGAIACKGAVNVTSPGRDCAKPNGSVTMCGYKYAGTCATKCTSSNGYFINCTHGSVTFANPVSTYLPY
jgi:hypothetical protein